ncbi:MAG: hypothetical protein O7B99_05250, partial [Planctomycetota bacterium]|nr:hypothetical protein [Planctomycetota bacterium]
MNAFPVVLAALVLAPGQGPISDERAAVEQAESILVRYDLSAVVPSVDAEGYQESLLRSAGNQHTYHFDRADLQDMYTSDGMDVVVDLIQNVLGAEFEYEGRRIDMSGENELLVLAPQEIQQKVRRILAALEGALSGAVQIRIDVVTMPAEGAGGLPEESVVDAARVDGLLEAMGRASSRETYELRLSPGRTSMLDLMREIPVLVDYDVEIAQGAAIHDPIVGYAEEGTRLLVRGSPAKGGVGLTVVYTRG